MEIFHFSYVILETFTYHGTKVDITDSNSVY